MYSRLTTATMYGSLMASLSQSQRNLQDLQTQIATGNKYGKLSDNPSAISRSLGIQSTINANDKYQTNTTNGITMLRYADAALNNVLDAVQSIRSLVIQAGDGALGGDQLKDRVYECTECGLIIDRDYNAALNLKSCTKISTVG